MADMADRIAAQARALFAELPEGELRDEDALRFTLSDSGRLTVLCERTMSTYTILGGYAWRGRAQEGGGVEILAFRMGRAVALEGVTPEDLEGQLWPRNIEPSA